MGIQNFGADTQLTVVIVNGYQGLIRHSVEVMQAPISKYNKTCLYVRSMFIFDTKFSATFYRQRLKQEVMNNFFVQTSPYSYQNFNGIVYMKFIFSHRPSLWSNPG